MKNRLIDIAHEDIVTDRNGKEIKTGQLIIFGGCFYTVTLVSLGKIIVKDADGLHTLTNQSDYKKNTFLNIEVVKEAPEAA